jgi:hypothetical protein
MLDTPRPVSDNDNKRYKGAVKTAPAVHDAIVEETNALREQHQKYKASLPKSLEDAVAEFKSLLGDDVENYPDALGASHHSHVLTARILESKNECDFTDDDMDALLWLVREGEKNTRDLIERMSRVTDGMWQASRIASGKKPI